MEPRNGSCYRCPYKWAKQSGSVHYTIYCTRYAGDPVRLDYDVYRVCTVDGPDLFMLLIDLGFWKEYAR